MKERMSKMGQVLLSVLAALLDTCIGLFNAAKKEGFGLQPKDWVEKSTDEKIQFMKNWYATRMLVGIGIWLALAVQWVQTNHGLWAIGSFFGIAVAFAGIWLVTFHQINTCQRYIFGDADNPDLDGKDFADSWVFGGAIQALLLFAAFACNSLVSVL